MKDKHLLHTLLLMMGSYVGEDPSELKEKLADMLWGNGSMLADRLRGVMLPSEEPNWGDRWPRGTLNCGCGEQSLRMMRFLQDRLLLGFSYLGGSQQPPSPMEKTDPDYQQEQDESARVCREVVGDIGMALTGEKVLFPNHLSKIFHMAAQTWREEAEKESMMAGTLRRQEADMLQHLGDVFRDSGEKGLLEYLLGTEG